MSYVLSLKNWSLKKLLPRTLFARSLLILTAPIILTLVISIYIFFDGHWSKTASKIAVGVAGEVAYIVDVVSENKDPALIQNLSDLTIKNLQLNLQYIEGGQIKLAPDNYVGRGQIIEKILSHELKKRIENPYSIIVDVEEKWTQVQVQLEEGALIITSPQRRLFSSSGYAFLLWMVSISSILLIVAVLFMRNQIRPIKRLAVAAERFGKGRDVPFFKPEGAREVRAAAQSFIGMRDRINKQIQQRTSMLAGVSHDLRTPLTRMKLQVEMLPDDEDRQALKSDVEEMQRMIDAYLQFAKGDGNEEMERVDLSHLLQGQQALFERDGFDVELWVETEKNFDLFLRPVAFNRCIGNIISNAKKYASKARITMSRDDENILIFIDDDGQGIDEAHYEDVFKPFYREEKSRNSKTGGVGLGLPIAQDIIFAHGGEINLDKSPQDGLRVVIQLPV